MIWSMLNRASVIISQYPLEHGIIQEAPEYYFRNLLITDDYAQLKDCKLIIECTKWLICKFSLNMYTRFPHLQ